MSGGGWVRPVHRWVSAVFTLTVVANLVAKAVAGTPPARLPYVPLLPLVFLMITGMHLFVLRHVRRKQRSHSSVP